MSVRRPDPPAGATSASGGSGLAPNDRIDSWKEIAAFLERSVRTVQRWEETEKPPIHRHVHQRGGSVFAYKSELEEWRASRYSLWNDTADERRPAVIPGAVESDRAAATRPIWHWAAALGAMAAVVGAAALWLRQPAPPRVPPVRTLVSEAGRISQTVLSPDGSKIIYCWNGARDEGNLDLYMVGIGGEAPRRLTSDPRNDHSTAWAADGRSFAFLRDTVGVMLMTPGGEERLLYPQAPGRVYGVGMSWSADGTYLLFSEKPSPDGAATIFRLTVASAGVVPLTNPPAQSNGDMYPSLAPDGRQMAFLRQTRGLGSDVYVVASGGGEPRRVTFDEKAIAGVDWMPAGRSLVFSSERAGPRRLWTVRVASGAAGRAEPELLISAGEDAFQPSVARQAGRLAYSRRHWTTSIWKLGLSPRAGGETPFTRLISSPRVDTDPVYSPDGGRIAFASYRSGATEIWTASSDGRNASQVTSLKRQKTYSPRFSPDGKTLAFHSASAGGDAVWAAPASGGPARQITPEAMGCSQPAWSARGDELYFSCTENRRANIWKTRLDAPAPVRVDNAEGAQPAISADGRWLYFTRRGDLARLALTGAAAVESLIGGPVGSYALTPGGVYFDRGSGDYKEGVIEYLDLQSRKAKLVRRLGTRKAFGLSWSPTGEALLVPINELQGSELLFIDGLS